MLVALAELRDFRSYEQAAAPLGERLTVVHGPNGAGKSNLLEAICFGCTGRSPRTRNDRELIRFGSAAARVSLRLRDDYGETHELSVGFGALGAAARLEKRVRYDGAPVEHLTDVPDRPLVSVFVPDRLELVNGPPALRRSHLDQLTAALWPSRATLRSDYARALAQRNALIARLRSGAASNGSLDAWDMELARHGVALIAARAAAVESISAGFATRCSELGLTGGACLEYRPRSRAEDPAELAGEIRARQDADVERGFTTHGPHRDDFALLRDRRHLRTYASQGERRLALLALLLAERAALAAARGAAPLMLLDDVMSELDESRRERLLADLRSAPGQSVIATTDLSHLPRAADLDFAELEVGHGTIQAVSG